MKFAAIASTAALIAVANAATQCDVSSLAKLVELPDTKTCASDSGYSVISRATPTETQMASMCTSTACQSVLSQLKSLAPSECSVGDFALYADLLTPLTNHCAGGASTGSSTGSSAPTTTVGSTAGSSTTGTVTASSTGSGAPTTTTAPTTSSGSSTPETTTSPSTAASAASAAASASGSSGASMAAVSAGAVLAAVAATFF